MMTSGNPIRAEKAKQYGLVDEVVAGDLLEGAIAFARRLVAEGKGPRRVRDMSARVDGDPKAFFESVRARVAKESRGYPAPLEIVACAEAAVTKPFDEGRKFERERFEVLVNTTESKALRHMFFAERQAAKIPDVPEDTPVRAIRKAAVIGAGTMGGGIAMSFANAGIPVTVVEMTARVRCSESKFERYVTYIVTPAPITVAMASAQISCGNARKNSVTRIRTSSAPRPA